MNTSKIACSSIIAIWLILAAGPVAAAAKNGAQKTLDIYFIDVAGGQSTLVVTPDHHSLLIDTGWAGDGTGFRPGDPHKARDANRIVAAAYDAGITQIDYLLMTHFHPDHDGGVKELSELMPIRAFIDHGTVSADAVKTSPETRDAFDAYLNVRGSHDHLQPAPGDRLPLTDVEAIVVSSAGATLKSALPGAGARNSACGAKATPPRDPYENPRSTGVVIRYGKFRFLDVGDLTGQPLFDLVCPSDMIGPVDAYLVAHHGAADVMVQETFGALRPRVAIMNNGLTKSGARTTFEDLHRVTTPEAVWQLAASRDAAESNFAPKYISNLEQSTANWIKLVAYDDGSFRLMNQRTGEWIRYPAK